MTRKKFVLAITLSMVMVGLAVPAGAATTIEWADRSVPAGTYNWHDTANWKDIDSDGVGDIPDAEGESAKFYLVRNAVDARVTVDLAGTSVDLYGTGGDPGSYQNQYCYGQSGAEGGIYLIDSIGGASMKVLNFNPRAYGEHHFSIPVTAMGAYVVDFRGCDVFQAGDVTTPLIQVGQGNLTLEAGATVSAPKVEMWRDGSPFSWGWSPSMTANTAITGCTEVVMGAGLYGNYIAGADGALGTGTVTVDSGSLAINAAQTTFPTITMAADTAVGGDMTGAVYGTNINVLPGTILGDTVGSNNPTRVQAGGATLYQPVVDLTAGQTVLVGDDGVGPYMGIGIGGWSNTEDVEAKLEARAGSDLNVRMQGQGVNLGTSSLLVGATGVANIKIMPGRANEITLDNGGINEAADASTPNLITTFNLDGMAGDMSGAIDKIPSVEGWRILRSSGTGKILPGQTVKITNGLYAMDCGGAVDTIGGRLIIGAGGALEMVDSTYHLADPDAVPPVLESSHAKIQATATGHLELQERGLLKVANSDSLDNFTAAQVTVSGTPLLCISNAYDGFFQEWVAEINMDAATQPALDKVRAQADIILHSGYHVYEDRYSYRRNKFTGDGLRVRDGGIVCSTAHVYDNPGAGAGMHQDTSYFGPDTPGGSFTLAAHNLMTLRIYCPITAPGSTIYVGSETPVETITATSWYPYHSEVARVSEIPTGSTIFYEAVDAKEVIVMSGKLEANGDLVDDMGVHLISQGAGSRLEIRNDFADGSVTVGQDTFGRFHSSGVTVDNLTINGGPYVQDVNGLRINGDLNVAGTLSGTGGWGDGSSLVVKETGTLAPGASVGQLGDRTSRGLRLEDDATFELEIANPDGDPGTGWDLAWGSNQNPAVDLDADNDDDGYLTLKLVDADMTRALEATDEIVFLAAGGNLDIPATWTITYDAPTGWDTSGAQVLTGVMDIDGDGTAENVVYLTGVVSVPALMGDANGDGWVDDDDLSLLLANWQAVTDWQHGEFSGDTPVDDDDLSLLLANWTGTPPAGLVVPEPASVALLGLGALVLMRRRRK